MTPPKEIIDLLRDTEAKVVGYTAYENGPVWSCNISIQPINSLLNRLEGSGLYSMLTSNGLRWDIINGWHESPYSGDGLARLIKADAE